MVNYLDIVGFLAVFTIISLASGQVGSLFKRLQLPLISGYLFTGVLAGPHVLGLISLDAVHSLRFLDELALAFIALAAGNELYLRELRASFRSIRWVTVGLVISTFTLGSLSLFLLSDKIPFMQEMSRTHRMAVALLAGAILVARSPSSAIALVNELRAKGPFTRTALAVTVIMDVVVISVFAVNSSIADALLTDLGFDLGFLALLAGELLLSLALGIGLGKLIQLVLAFGIKRDLKIVIVLLTGYGVFFLSATVRDLSRLHLSFEVLLEPLLICMVGGFVTTNYSHYRAELRKALHKIGSPIYIVFFTLTGAALALDILVRIWPIAVALFGVRLAGIILGSFWGGLLAGVPPNHNRIGWMCYITQAGVGLGLAKEVVVEFPQWGSAFATIMIAVIVLNQMVGPPLFKWAIQLAGEAHPRAERPLSEGVREAVIFGLEGQSLALARSLISNGWEVRIVSSQVDYIKATAESADIEILPVTEINLGTLHRLGVHHAEAIVGMMADDENYQICEIAYEHFGTKNLIVRLNNRYNFKRFHELGVVVVEPTTAIISLLDQFVRSPSAASLLLGMEDQRNVIEFELRNPDLANLAIRDLYLPLDVQILSVRRRNEMLLSDGYTRLKVGDWVTVVGSRSSLEQMMLRFDSVRGPGLFQLVSRATPKELVTHALGSEVKNIMRSKDDDRRIRFHALIENSIVLDMDHSITFEQFFKSLAEVMAPRVNLPPGELFELLMAREAESSTVLRPDLAIPHLIIEGTHVFSILLARSKSGIYFSALAPRVRAVFAILGSRDERNYHLYVLSTLAQVVQDIDFSQKWLKAADEAALRHLILG